jgi:tetratricopeptide (TPR) repeat protein
MIKLSLAQQQYADGRLEMATRTVTECISADPEMPQAHLLLGKLLLAHDSREDAVKALQLAVELDENLAEAYYWLGLAAQGPTHTQQSWQMHQTAYYYNKAMTLNPTNVEYILAVAETYAAQAQPEQAMQLLEQKMQAMPREVSLRVAAADLLHRMGSSDHAVELYKEALLMTGDDEGIAESLGYCYMFSGKWNEAAEIFNRLAERCRQDSLSQQDDKAAEHHEQKKKLYLRVAALCSVNSAQYGKAIDWYGELSADQKDNPEIWVRMGQAALGAGMTDRAMMCGQRALALLPGYADAIVLVGCAEYARGDYTAAAQTFEKIATDDKNVGFAWLMRARCYEKLQMTTEAELAYKKAVEIDPHSKLGGFLAKRKETNASQGHGQN